MYNVEEAQQKLKAAQKQASYDKLGEKDLGREIKRVEKDMLTAARNLEFEKAAELRDQLKLLKELLFGVDESGHI